jgi:hypothetical protein
MEKGFTDKNQRLLDNSNGGLAKCWLMCFDDENQL